jgi:lysophospholipase L1-like esterase
MVSWEVRPKASITTTDPLPLDARYNTRDHLHPNDAGYKVMDNAIDLKMVAER